MFQPRCLHARPPASQCATTFTDSCSPTAKPYTYDQAKRTKILQDLLALNSENAAMIYMVELRDLTGLNKRVQGFKNEIQRWNVHEVTFR